MANVEVVTKFEQILARVKDYPIKQAATVHLLSSGQAHIVVKGNIHSYEFLHEDLQRDDGHGNGR